MIYTLNLGKYKSKLELSPDEGGRIISWSFGDLLVISDPEKMTYKDSYAASLLCPFVNRINDGKYSYNNKNYQLSINEHTLRHALHGLVYNKSFQLKYIIEQEELSSIGLRYDYQGNEVGYPFPFSLEIEYELSNQSLSLVMKVINLSDQAIPMALGWHPYFNVADKKSSGLTFDSEKKIINDNRNIPVDNIDLNERLTLKFDEFCDDCYQIQSGMITFYTSDYCINFDLKDNIKFLQIYSPPNENVIAIEPVTAAANCFNNNIGLQIIPPFQGMSYKATLTLTQP